MGIALLIWNYGQGLSRDIVASEWTQSDPILLARMAHINANNGGFARFMTLAEQEIFFAADILEAKYVKQYGTHIIYFYGWSRWSRIFLFTGTSCASMKTLSWAGTGKITYQKQSWKLNDFLTKHEIPNMC
jgi:hypothetical protein